MAKIKNLKVKAGEENIIKAPEVDALYIIPKCFPDNIKRPFIDGKKFVIEAVNGRWEFDLDDVSFIEFDTVTEKRIIHVFSRSEVNLEDAEIQ